MLSVIYFDVISAFTEVALLGATLRKALKTSIYTRNSHLCFSRLFSKRAMECTLAPLAPDAAAGVAVAEHLDRGQIAPHRGTCNLCARFARPSSGCTTRCCHSAPRPLLRSRDCWLCSGRTGSSRTGTENPPAATRDELSLHSMPTCCTDLLCRPLALI